MEKKLIENKAVKAVKKPQFVDYETKCKLEDSGQVVVEVKVIDGIKKYKLEELK